jgi:Leu/Phe-tRNA-protein transferase
MYPLRYLSTGHVFIDPVDECDRVVDALLETGYGEEFCLAKDFEEGFIGRLMEAGFLVMSMELKDGTPAEQDDDNHPGERFFILLPKLHLVRSVLFFPDLHIKKSIRSFLSRYELRINTDFDLIADKCVQVHGAAWLTPPLVEILKGMHQSKSPRTRRGEKISAMPVSFGAYRDGELKAGEIGVVMGRVYTSYSGYYEEGNAGTAQMILTAKRLEEEGFDFLDFGMPLDYKTFLGAQNISPHRFVELFRTARY